MANNVYCGNNSRNTKLLNGDLLPGSRYSCLQKGIAKGRNLTHDVNYEGEYEPIDNTKIYCGTKNILPDGYDRMGNNVECFRKGVGVGKRLRAQNSPSVKYNKKTVNIVIYFIIIFVIFLILYYSKPTIILDNDNKKNKKIVWYKFLIFYTILCLIIGILMFFYTKK
jgi:hypothetical protein